MSRHIAASVRFTLRSVSRSSGFIFIAVSMWTIVLLPGTARAYFDTQTFGMPAHDGSVEFEGIFDQSGEHVSVSILGTDSAAQKAQKIADAFGVTVTGTSTVTLPLDLILAHDFTGEHNNDSVSLDLGQKVQLVMVPANVTGTPVAGTSFAASLFTTDLGSIDFSVIANGSQTYFQLFSGMQTLLTNAIGVPFSPVVIGSQTGFISLPFDPSLVTIDWDANTSLDLANFGFALSPEPGTGLLVSAGLLGLVSWRRRT